MKISKKILFLFILSFSPYSLSAWGGVEKLNDGSCKFDLDTGYKSSSIYIKNSESFVIIDGGDSRYGTISTVYNALTCEEVTSGEKAESNFSGLMERKGFKEVELINKSIIDKSFQNKITILESNDNLTVHIEPIDSGVTEELKTLISMLSDMSASSQINISSSAKEFLGYPSFYTIFFDKLNGLLKKDINYNYALSLIDKLQKININVNSSKGILLAKQKQLREQIARIKKETNDKFFESSVKGINDVPRWMDKMAQLGKQELISDYIPKIMKLPDFGKKLNFSNFLTSIEYKYILKDIQLKKVWEIKEDDEKYGIALKYPTKTIRLTQKPTCKSTGQTSTAEFSCGFFWVNTCVGTYSEYNCKGSTSKIAQIERQLLGTTKVTNILKKGWKYEPMISRYTKTNSSNIPSGQNMCLGKWDKSYCYSSNLSKSEKNMCSGKWDKSYCYSSNLSKSERNMCLGKWDKSYCYSSNLSKSERNMCLGKWDKSYCYSSNLSRSERNMCLGWRDKSYCYSSEI